jgi:hypothetical protein
LRCSPPDEAAAIWSISAPQTPIGTVEDAAIARNVARLSGGYVLRAFQLLLEGFGGVRAALLVQAINTANVGALRHTWDARRGPGTVGMFPDDMRRPVSIARLADSSGLPFESTRRIVHGLVDAHTCLRLDGGVILPKATLEGPRMTRVTAAILGYVRRFVRDLGSVGLAEDSAPDRRSPPDGDMEAAVGYRAAPFSNEYILRVLELLAEFFGDVRTGIVALTIATANTAHLEDRAGDGWRYASLDHAPPDDLRKPISAARLAESLGFPYETMRQHVRRLLDSGVCVRVDGGLIIPTAVVTTPAAARATLINVRYVRKFVRDLAGIGISAGQRPRVDRLTVG